jgi:hypothetical protein
MRLHETQRVRGERRGGRKGAQGEGKGRESTEEGVEGKARTGLGLRK